MILLCHLRGEPTVRGILSSINTVPLTNAQLEVRSRGIKGKEVKESKKETALPQEYPATNITLFTKENQKV